MSRKLLYVGIADKIRSDILNGNYPVSTLLPTEKEFEELFAVSKITIRKAIEILSDEGYVEKKSGVGTIVISDRLFNKLSKVVSFSTLLEEEYTLEKKLINLKRVDFEIEKNEDLLQHFGSKALKLERMYFLDGQPYIYFEHYFNNFDVNLNTAMKEIEEKSIYRWLSDYGDHVASFRDEFEVKQLSSFHKKILNTTASHGLLRIRKSKNESDEIVEISIGIYNTEMKPYIIEYEI